MRTGAVLILTGGGEREIDVERLTGLEDGEVTSLLVAKQEGWKVFTGREEVKSSL